MLKKNVAGLEKMAADWLQYRWRMYLHSIKKRGDNRANPDFVYYCGACGLIEAMGGEWRREYAWDNSEEQLTDPAKYHHLVILPSDEKCKRLNFDAWKE